MLVINLLSTAKDESRFVLRMAKRNKRTGAIDLDDNRTSLIHLKHAEDSILWEQTAAPFALPNPKKTKEELSEVRKQAAWKEINDLDGLVAKITKPMKKTEIYELAKKDGHGSPHLLRRDWNLLEAKLSKTSEGLFLTNNRKMTQKPLHAQQFKSKATLPPLKGGVGMFYDFNLTCTP